MIKAWQASSIEKVMPDTLPPMDTSAWTSLQVTAARGETEAVQLALYSEHEKTEVVSIDKTPLRQGKTEIDFNVRIVGFVNVTKPSHNDGEVGIHPDPLFPFEPFLLEKTRSLWIDVAVPRNVPAGLYDGKLQVKTSNGNKVEARIELYVYNFVLPQPQKLVTAFGLYEEPLRQRYGERYELMLRKFRENMWAHHITHLAFPATDIPLPDVSVSPDGKIKIDYTKFDRAIEENLRRGMNAIDIPIPARYITKEKRLDSPYDMTTLERIMADYEKHLITRRWIDMSYFFLVDEPSRDAFDTFVQIQTILNRAAPHIKRRLDMGYGAYGGKPGTVKEAEYRKLKGYVEIWVPHIDCVDQEFFDSERANGNEVWWYICCSAKHPYPNCLIDYPLLDSRIPFWMLFNAKATGYAYWTVNWWNEDPFTNPRSFEPTNGDGMLIYPGENGPVDSIRWEAIRDGIEDYEYFTLLKAKITEIQEKNITVPAIPNALEALDAIKSAAPLPNYYTKDSQLLMEIRHRVGTVLESLNEKGEGGELATTRK